MQSTQVEPVSFQALGDVKCPMEGCDRTFSCDACLHIHLVKNYRLRHAEVFGPTHDAWVAFCERHQDCSPGMLAA